MKTEGFFLSQHGVRTRFVVYKDLLVPVLVLFLIFGHRHFRDQHRLLIGAKLQLNTDHRLIQRVTSDHPTLYQISYESNHTGDEKVLRMKFTTEKNWCDHYNLQAAGKTLTLYLFSTTEGSFNLNAQ
jgi:hypothetical protein